MVAAEQSFDRRKLLDRLIAKCMEWNVWDNKPGSAQQSPWRLLAFSVGHHAPAAVAKSGCQCAQWQSPYQLESGEVACAEVTHMC